MWEPGSLLAMTLGIVLLAGQVGEDSAGLGTERHDPPPGLRFGQVQLAGLQVDMLSQELLEFREPAAPECQQPHRRDRRAGLGPVLEEDFAIRAQALEVLSTQ